MAEIIILSVLSIIVIISTLFVIFSSYIIDYNERKMYKNVRSEYSKLIEDIKNVDVLTETQVISKMIEAEKSGNKKLELEMLDIWENNYQNKKKNNVKKI
jgi:DNA-binding helix-hairpin-helix protein with protein kinase domain